MSNCIYNHSKLLITANKRVLLFSHAQSRLISATSISVPTDQQIAHLILEQRSANQAIETFEWASNIPSFTHTPSTYRALIHKLCAFRQFKIVDQVLDEMTQRIGSPPADDIFITIARGFGRARMTRQVIGVLDLAIKFGKAPPSLKLLNTILDVLVKEDIDIAREFFRKKMMGSGVKGDAYSYGILMKGFCLTNRIGDGFKLLQVLKCHGIKPNAVVYNTLLYALCKNGKVGRARSLMNEMEEFSVVTYNILISAYCKEKNLVHALVMMEKCLSNGFVPDIVSLTKLIETLCSKGRITDAVEVLERAEKNGGNLDVVAYNTLLEGFVRAGKVKPAYRYLKQMEMKGCLPDTKTYNILIKGFCDSEMLDSATDMFDEMKRAGVKWDFDTFQTLIHGFCSAGKTRDGFKMFETMLEGAKKGWCRRIEPYNSIIYGLYKENCMDRALEFLDFMRSLFPRVVNRSLGVVRLCEEGNVDEAKRILGQMKEEGDIPSAIVYASLIRVFCERGMMKEGIEVTNEMIGRGYIPVGSTLNGLIRGFCGRGKVGGGVRLMEDLRKRGCLVGCESYGEMIRGFCNEGELQKGVLLLMEMVGRGIAPDCVAWDGLIRVCLGGKSMLQEHQLLHRLVGS